MSDRDKFAAAALTGLLANIETHQLGVVSRQAYAIADEMLLRMKEKPAARRSAADNVTLTDDEREAIEACVKLIDKTKQHESMPKGPFMYWKYRKETLEELLGRAR